MSNDNKKQMVNDQIREPFVNLISSEGKVLGVVQRQDALQQAKSEGLDLVQVSYSSPPICKIIDYGKMMYKKAKQQKHHQPKNVMKEMRIKYNISDHDLSRKNSQVREFLGKKWKVKYVLELKGRQKGLPRNLIMEKFEGALAELDDCASRGKLSTSPSQYIVVLSPK